MEGNSQNLAGFEHRFTPVNQVRYHYVSGGSGDPLVLLHGWPETWYAWRKIAPQLAQRYRVIMPDLRGLGDTALTESGYNHAQVTDDIYQLLQSLNTGKVYLVGHDVGGHIAYHLAAAHPELVRKLVILDISPPDFFDEAGKVSHDFTLWHFSFHKQRELPEALIQGREKLYLSHFFRNYSYNPEAFSEAEIEENVRKYAAPGKLRAGFEYYRSLPADMRQYKELAQTPLLVPTLAVGGEAGFGELAFKLWEPAFENFRGDVIPQTGHFIATEKPADLLQRLLEFFGE